MYSTACGESMRPPDVQENEELKREVTALRGIEDPPARSKHGRWQGPFTHPHSLQAAFVTPIVSAFS